MRIVYLVSSENKAKAEDLLKKDEIVNRGSIVIRSAPSLEINEDGYFIVYDGTDEALKIADALLKDIAKKYEKAETVLKKIDDQENSAIEGFGNILGF
jgi:hypothetical protein